jgi:tape measure domain-containing protein
MANEKEYIIVLKAETKQLQKELKDARDSVKQMKNQTVKDTKAMSVGFGAFLGTFASTAAIAGINKVKDSLFALGHSAIQNAVMLEDMSVGFEVLTGSAEKASQVVEQLVEFSASTPFQIQGLQKTASQLLAFGFSSDQLIDKMQKIGDVAAATNRPIEEIGFIFGQISSAGKLTGERLLQLQERGIPILASLAKEFNTTEGAVREMVTKGKIDFATFENAFNKLSEEGGMAFEGMIKRSKTFSGLMSTLSDNLNLLSGKIGQALLPAMKLLVLEFLKLFKIIDVKKIQDFISIGIISLMVSVGELSKKLDTVARGFQFLTNSGAVFFNAMGIGMGGLTSLLRRLQQGFYELRAVMKEVANPFTDVSKEVNELQKQADEYGKKAKQNFNEAGESFDKVLNNFKNGWESVFGDDIIKDNQVKDFQNKIEEMKKSLEKINSNNTSGGDGGTGGDVGNGVEVLKPKTDEQIKWEEEKNAEILRLRQEHYLMLDEIEQERYELLNEQEKERLEKNLENMSSQDALEIQALEDKAKKEQDINKRRLLNEEINAKRSIAISKMKKSTEMANLSATANALGAFQQLAAQGGKRQFALQKALGLAQVPISIAMGIAKAQELGPPASYIQTAAVIAQGAAQLASISNQQPPAYQFGGIHNAGGSSISGDNSIARVNDREMILNMRQQANLFNIANNGLGGSNSVTNDLLAELVVINRNQSREVVLNGETLNNELDRLKSRSLG